MKNNATTPKNGSPIDSKQINNTPKKKTVTQLVLEEFLSRGKQGMNTYDAFKLFNVTCLHTYISNFKRDYNLIFTKVREKNGVKKPHVRYSLLTPSQVALAKNTVSYLDNKRGVSA